MAESGELGRETYCVSWSARALAARSLTLACSCFSLRRSSSAWISRDRKAILLELGQFCARAARNWVARVSNLADSCLILSSSR